MPTQATQATQATQINLADFDQFKSLMQTLVTKLEHFQPGRLSSIKTQINAQDTQIVGLESEISTLQYKQDYIQTQQKLGALQDVGDNPEIASQRTRLRNESQALLTGLGLTRDRLLDGKTLKDAKAQSEQEEKSKLASVRNLKNYRSKLVEEQDKLVPKINQQLQEFNQTKQTIQEQLNSLSSPATAAEKKALYDSLQTLTKTAPDETYRRTLTLLDLNARAGLSEEVTKKIQQQLNDQLRDSLSQAGNSKEVKVNLSLGVGFGVLSSLVGGVDLSIDAEMSYSISVGNDRRIAVNSSKLGTLSGGVSLGQEDSEILSASTKLKGKLQSGQKRTFNTVEDFVEAETSRISTAFTQYANGKNPFDITPLKQAYRQQKAINLREEARRRQSQLNKYTQLLGLIEQDKSFAVPEEAKVTFGTTDFHAVSGGAELGIKGGSGLVDLGIGWTSTYKSAKSARTINFLDNMLENRLLSEIYTQKKPEYVGFAVDEGEGKTVYKGNEGSEKLEALQVNINALKKDLELTSDSDTEKKERLNYALSELRLQVKDALSNLYSEYQEFTQLANRKDSPEAPGEVKKRLERLKTDRGVSTGFKSPLGDTVGSRAEYLKAITIQYARLANLYYGSFSQGETPMDWDSQFNDQLQDFKTLLINPQYFIQQDDLEKVFNAKQIASGKEISHLAHFTVGGDLISSISDSDSLSVKVTKTDIQKADNEYTEGKGLSVEIELSSSESLQDTIKETIQQINQGTGLNIDESVVDTTIGSEQLQLEPSLESGEIHKTELSFAENEGSYYLQYVRIYDQRTRDFNAKTTIDSGAGVSVKVGGGVGTTHTRNTWEFMGDNTITYVRDIYTGLKRGERTQDWEKFKTDGKSFLNRFFKQLGQDGSNVAQEMAKDLAKINDPQVTHDWNTALSNYRSDPEGKYEELLSVFDQVMEKRYRVFKQDSDARFVNSLTTKDLKTYVNSVLSKAATEFAGKYNVPATVNQDINSLREWAEGEYFKNRSQNNFGILEQAYALDYASHSLNDLLQSPDEIKRQKTTLELLGGNYIEQCLQNPQVYLQDGVSGKMVVTLDPRLNSRNPRLIFLNVTIGSDVDENVNYRKLVSDKFSKINDLGQKPTNNVSVKVGQITREGDAERKKIKLPDSCPKTIAQIIRNYRHRLGSVIPRRAAEKILNGTATANEIEKYSDQIIAGFQNALSEKEPGNYSEGDLEILTRLLHENYTRLQNSSSSEMTMKVISKTEIGNLLKKESGDRTLTGFSSFNEYSETLSSQDTIRRLGLDYQYYTTDVVTPYLMSQDSKGGNPLPFVYYVTTPMTEDIKKNNAKIPLDSTVKRKLDAIAKDPTRDDKDEIKKMAKELTADGVYHELSPQYSSDKPRYGTQTDGKKSYADMLRSTYSTSSSQLSPGATIRAKGPNGEDFRIADWDGMSWTVSPQSAADLPDWLKTQGRAEDRLNVDSELKAWKTVGDNKITPPTNIPAPVRAFMEHHFQTSLGDITIQKVANSTTNDDSSSTVIKFKPGAYDDTTEDGLKKIAQKLGDALKLKVVNNGNQLDVSKAMIEINKELPRKSVSIKNELMKLRKPRISTADTVTTSQKSRPRYNTGKNSSESGEIRRVRRTTTV